jgi:hypothetical protein
VWYTWLAFFGLVAGLVASGIFNTSLLRSAGIGFAAGVVLAAIWNVLDPTTAPCLQSSKGWDILRAYQFC